MAKINPNSLISSMSGSICSHDGTYFATNKQTGKTYAVKRCFPSDAEPTAKQLAARQAFGEKAKTVSAWLKANKPTLTNTKGTEAYQTMLAGYKSQHKVGSVMAYVRQHIDENGNINFGGTQSSGSGPGSIVEG